MRAVCAADKQMDGALSMPTYCVPANVCVRARTHRCEVTSKYFESLCLSWVLASGVVHVFPDCAHEGANLIQETPPVLSAVIIAGVSCGMNVLKKK